MKPTVLDILNTLQSFTRVEIYDAEHKLVYIGTAGVAKSECSEYAECFCDAKTKFFKSKWTSQILMVCYIHMW